MTTASYSSETEPPVYSVVHVDYYDEHGIILCRYPKGWTEPGRDCDAPNFPGYMTWERVCEFGKVTLLVAADEAERMRPVIEAVQAWRAAELPPDAHNKVYRALNALAIAIDTYDGRLT